jgi:hypothetical protein
MPELARGEITNAYRASNAAVQELHWLELNLQRLGVRLVYSVLSDRQPSEYIYPDPHSLAGVQ